MSDPVILTLAPAASSANNIALSQTPAGAGNLVLTGAAAVVAGPAVFQGVKYTNYAVLDVARRVQISDAGSDATVVFTLAGFNRDGQPIGETITGVTSATPGISVYDYLIVTSIAVSAATTGAITVGTVTAVTANAAIASTPWVLVNPYSTSWNLSAAVALTGTPLSAVVGVFSIEHTYDDPNKSISPPMGGFVVGYGSVVPPFVWIPAGTSGKFANLEFQYPGQPIMAHRVTLYAGSSPWAGGSGVIFWSLQGGIKS